MEGKSLEFDGVRSPVHVSLLRRGEGKKRGPMRSIKRVPRKRQRISATKNATGDHTMGSADTTGKATRAGLNANQKKNVPQEQFATGDEKCAHNKKEEKTSRTWDAGKTSDERTSYPGVKGKSGSTEVAGGEGKS